MSFNLNCKWSQAKPSQVNQILKIRWKSWNKLIFQKRSPLWKKRKAWKFESWIKQNSLINCKIRFKSWNRQKNSKEKSMKRHNMSLKHSSWKWKLIIKMKWKSCRWNNLRVKSQSMIWMIGLKKSLVESLIKPRSLIFRWLKHLQTKVEKE